MSDKIQEPVTQLLSSVTVCHKYFSFFFVIKRKSNQSVDVFLVWHIPLWQRMTVRVLCCHIHFYHRDLRFWLKTESISYNYADIFETRKQTASKSDKSNIEISIQFSFKTPKGGIKVYDQFRLVLYQGTLTHRELIFHKVQTTIPK